MGYERIGAGSPDMVVPLYSTITTLIGEDSITRAINIYFDWPGAGYRSAGVVIFRLAGSPSTKLTTQPVPSTTEASSVKTPRATS